MKKQLWLPLFKTLFTACILAALISCGYKGNRSDPNVGARLGGAAGGASPAPRTVSLDAVLREIDAYPVPKDVSSQTWTMLVTELKKQLVARSKDGKTLSIAPTGPLNAVSDLAAASNPTGTQAAVTWTEVLAGDCNNDGQVGIADLQPIAAHYGETSSGPGSAAYLADANGDGQVGITDLQPIAADYSMHLEGYQVWRGHWNGTTTDWEGTFCPNTNPANSSWSSDRPAPPAASRPSYTYTDDIRALADKANERYKVTAYGDGVSGEDSNEATMPAPPATYSVSGTVLNGASGLAGVTMTLTPGGYNALTQTDGTYSIPGVPSGAYTVTPEETGFAFTPTSRQVTVSGADVPGQDFIVAQAQTWTVMFYNAGDNSLGSAMYDIIDQVFEQIGSSNSVALTVEAKLAYVTNDGVTQNMAFRYHALQDSTTGHLNFGSGSLYQDLSFPTFDSASKASIEDFINWSKTSFPATHYVLILSSHGSGWTDGWNPAAKKPKVPTGIINDDSFNRMMRNGDVASAISATGLKPDVLVLDACDMGTIEVAYDFKDVCNWLVFSETSVPDDGVPYGGTIAALKAAPSMTAAAVAQSLVNGYQTFYSDPGNQATYGVDYSVALSAVDMSQLPAAVASTKTLRDSIMASISSEIIGLRAGVDASLSLDFPPRQTDFDSFLSEYHSRTTDPSILAATLDLENKIPSLVPYHSHVNVLGAADFGAENGLVIYVPDTEGHYIDDQTDRAFYGSVLPFNQATHWLDVVDGMWYVPPTHNVSGTVTRSTGGGLAGVVVKLSPGGANATSGAGGVYTILYVPEGTYTMTAHLLGYAFTPTSRDVVVSSADVTGQDFTATAATLAVTPWPKFHGDLKNTGLSPYVGSQTGTLKWSRSTGGLVRSSPTIGPDGTVFVGSDDGKVYAINPADGTVKWSYATSIRPVESAGTVAGDGTVYIGGDDELLHSLNGADGTENWNWGSNNSVRSSATILSNGRIYFASEDDEVRAVDPDAIGWGSFSANGAIRSALAVADDETIYFGSQDNNVYAVHPDLTLKWMTALGAQVYSSPAVGADGTIYVGCLDMNVYALNPADGSIKWTSSPTGGWVWSSPAIGPDGTIYIGSYDNNVYALNPLDGSLKWAHPTGGQVYSSPAVGADGTIYIGSGDDYLYALSPVDGSVKWQYLTGGPVMSSPAIDSDGTIYVGSDDKNLYAFGP